MEKQAKLLIFYIMLFFGFFQVRALDNDADSLTVLKPKKEHPNVLFVTLNLLESYHYRKISINDSLSSAIYDNYISSLDPSKSYFLASDIAYFEKYRQLIDDELKNTSLDFGYMVFTVFRERALERYAEIPKLLKKEFDFNENDYYETDYDKVAWAMDRKELTKRWGLILKNQALSYRMSDAAKPWQDIADALNKRYERIIKSVYQYNSEDVFQSYINAVCTAFDPHTDYFSPITSQNFQINMSLSLEGIGARLTQNLDYTQVADIVPGGPAAKSKLLQKDDKIIGVAQGDTGDFIDVIGWRLDDVVQKIRGPKGTVVRLQILKAGGDMKQLPDTIRLVREKIKLEDEAASAEVLPITQAGKTYKMGVITIPSFYISFEDRNSGTQDYKSTTRDVKRLIDSLRNEKIDGLMVDLRFNGGGSLQEAIDLTGLFIPKGTVVQVRNMDQSVEQLDDQDGNKVYYDGPLAVLINRYSASASEIFAGAIQDYKRGIIVGENSFGKGTVQNLIDLDRPVLSYLTRMTAIRQSGNRDVTEFTTLKNDIQTGEVKLGQLKLTLAKFYRATGNSTQLLGVKPDIEFPSPFDPAEFGESSTKNPLPWDEILTASFKPTNDISPQMVQQLQRYYEAELQSDAALKEMIEDIAKAKAAEKETKISLNLEARKAESTGNQDLSVELETGELVTTEESIKKLDNDVYLKQSLKLLAGIAKMKMG